MAEEEKSEEEKQQEKEKKREVALANIQNDDLINLATAYLVNSSGKYGEAGDSAVEQFIYMPSLRENPKIIDEEGNEGDIITQSLLSSRQDGRRYSGNINEYDTIKTAAGIAFGSLDDLKVSDVYELLGSEIGVSEKYKDSYLSDLKEGDEDSQKLYKQLSGGYQGYVVDTKVSEALGKRASTSKSGLEELVKEEEAA